MSVFDDIAVCIPTVRSRAEVLEETLAEWRRFDVTPLVQLQPDDWPQNGPSQRRNADCTLRRALDERPDASHVLFCEDDVLLAPELEVWIPALTYLGAPSTLFLSGWRNYPRSFSSGTAGAVPERLMRVRRMPVWWGTLAILLPRSIAEDVLRWESDLKGWDVHLGAFLRRHAVPLFAPVPNLVQHRGIVSSLHPEKRIERSATFGRPSDGGGISPPSAIKWCPYGDWDPDPRVS
jgi:hypothetical protein